MGLGPLHTISLAEARELARDQRKLRLQGIDPIEHRTAQRQAARLEAAKAITFDAAAAQYLAANADTWRNAKHRAQWKSTLKTYVTPVFGKMSVAAIDTALVLRAIEPIWKTKPETAGRVRGRIETILDWARSHGYRMGENPARWVGHLENILPARSKIKKVEHHPALPWGEIADFFGKLNERPALAARALELTILTAARTS